MNPFILLVGALFLLPSFHAVGQGSSAQEYYQLGKELYYDAKYDSAVSVFELAASAYRESGDTVGLVKSFYEKGENLSNLGKCSDATEIIEEGIKLSLSLVGASDTLTARGYYFLSRSVGGCSRNFAEAIELVQKSVRIRQVVLGPDDPLLAYDYNILGYYFNSSGSHDSAIYYLDKAYEIRTSQKTIDSVELSHTLFNLAKAYENLGEVFIALDYGERSLAIRQKYLTKNHPTISNSLSDIGTIYKTVGDYDKALEYYQQSLEIRKESLGQNHVNVGASYYTIGVLYGSVFNYQRAIPFIEQGNLIVENALGEDTPVLLTYFAFLGSMYGHVGKHDEASAFLMKAKNLGEKYLDPNHIYLGIIYAFIGNYYGEIAETEKQIDYLTKAKNIFQKSLGSVSIREADVLIELGEGYLVQDEWKLAEAHLKLAMDMTRKLLGEKNPKTATIHQDLGDLYLRSGDRESALKEYMQSLKSLTLDSIQDDLRLDISSVSHQQLALIGIQKIASVYQSTGDQENLLAAYKRYLLAMEIIEAISQDYDLEVSRAQLGEETRKVFEEAVTVAYSLYQQTGDESFVKEAFHIVEKSKSPILLSKIKDTELKRSLGVPDNILMAEREIAIELAYFKQKLRESRIDKNISLSNSLQAKVFNLQTTTDSLKDQLEVDYPEYFAFKYQDVIPPIEEVQAVLDERTIILEYFLSDVAGYVFSISNDHFEMQEFQTGERLLGVIEGYTESLTNAELLLNDSRKSDSLFSHTAYYLYDKLVAPALVGVEGKDRLVIMPDGVLSHVNFNVFISSLPEVINYVSLDYLISQFDISYAYSATLNSRKIERTNRLSFAGFAPSYKPDSYNQIDSLDHPMAFELVRDGKLPLPGAIAEVVEIGSMMNGSTWLNEEASETNFKTNSGNFGILHLAMHSLLNANEPLYSELLFNAEKDSINDGFLAIDEIYNLKLNAAMVVLSACSSGSGALQVGEGPISFSRAFRYAGCPSVVMSMWKVPDEATSEIMIAFYKKLKEGGMKDGALRQSELAYLKNQNDPLKQHPFYWAGFVALGDTQPVETQSGGWIIWMIISGCVILGTVFILRRTYFSS